LRVETQRKILVLRTLATNISVSRTRGQMVTSVKQGVFTMTCDFDTARVATKPKSEIVVDMMAALHKLDALARDMERKRGACRLAALVPADLAKRFYSQHRKVSLALREGRNQDALRETKRMVTAWRFLDQEADRLGAEPIHPAVWEVALSDGTVVAIVQDEDSAAAVDPQDRAMKVYMLSEIA